MISVAVDIIFGRVDFPSFWIANSLLPQIDFNEFLNLIIGASKPIKHPIDSNSFQNQGKSNHEKRYVVTHLILRSGILINARNKKPEYETIV